MFKKLMGFLQGVISEDGEGSYSRVASATIVLSSIAWVTYLVIKNHAIPDMAGVSTFVGAGTAANYGANKLPDIVSAFKGTGTPPDAVDK